MRCDDAEMGMQASAKTGPKSVLNVTPLVDVVLVLLVIFMITMPVMLRSIRIVIPPEAPSDPSVVSSPPILVVGKVDGSLEIRGLTLEERVQRPKLAKSLRKHLAELDGHKTVFVDFEDGIQWDDAVSVMDTIEGIGRDEPLTLALRKANR